MDEERKSGLTIKGLLVRLILIIIFIFLLIWLFPMPNLKPLNNQIFSDNLDRMKNVAKTYYTVERLPKDINSFKKMTLEEMVDNHLILPLMDSNGKYCSEDKSYIQVTKLENEYIIKVYLSCTDKTDYIIEHFGCYDICSDACKKIEAVANSTTKKVTTLKKTTTPDKKTTTKISELYEYQYAKESCSEEFDKYACQAGYTLNGSNCVKNGTATRVVAADEKVSSTTSTDTKEAKAIVNESSSLVGATCVDKTNSSTINANAKATTYGATKKTTTQTVTADKVVSYETKPAMAVKKATTVGYTTIQNYNVITATQVATGYKWTYDYTTISTSSALAYTKDNEKLVYIDSFLELTCPTCFTTVKKYKYYHYVKEYTGISYNCDSFSGYSLYNGKYCRKPTTVTKTCPSGYENTGSNCKKVEIVSYNCDAYGTGYTLDSSTKTCKKSITSYKCPAGTTATSDQTKCTRQTVSYSCPAGTTATSDQTKCTKTSYSCPANTSNKTYTLAGTKCNVKTTVKSCTCPAGTNPTSDETKCAKKTSKTTYSCADYSGYSLTGNKCVKTTTKQNVSYSCTKGILVDKTCIITENTSDVKKANITYKTSCQMNYKWSTETSIDGWSYTGNKRLVK